MEIVWEFFCKKLFFATESFSFKKNSLEIKSLMILELDDGKDSKQCVFKSSDQPSHKIENRYIECNYKKQRVFFSIIKQK
jgi:hypothetical protein